MSAALPPRAGESPARRAPAGGVSRLAAMQVRVSYYLCFCLFVCFSFCFCLFQDLQAYRLVPLVVFVSLIALCLFFVFVSVFF